MARISGAVEEKVSRDEEAKFRWGDWGPKEVENAAARTPLQSWRLPSVHTSMHSMVWGVENAQEGATRTFEHGCLEILMRSRISWNVSVRKSSELSFKLLILFSMASVSSLTCWLKSS